MKSFQFLYEKIVDFILKAWDLEGQRLICSAFLFSAQTLTLSEGTAPPADG